ncbi:hypothetical protein ACFXAF_14805 [Kitasatospora sp. NPDC059463]|uniref:hypothetical protein n=1 Tax=unclassified Kitasatospora TaxID=2633591 RepID=UPI0036D04A68
MPPTPQPPPDAVALAHHMHAEIATLHELDLAGITPAAVYRTTPIPSASPAAPAEHADAAQ